MVFVTAECVADQGVLGLQEWSDVKNVDRLESRAAQAQGQGRTGYARLGGVRLKPQDDLAEFCVIHKCGSFFARQPLAIAFFVFWPSPKYLFNLEWINHSNAGQFILGVDFVVAEYTDRAGVDFATHACLFQGCCCRGFHRWPSGIG